MGNELHCAVWRLFLKGNKPDISQKMHFVLTEDKIQNAE